MHYITFCGPNQATIAERDQNNINGPKFIPKDNKTVNEMLHKNVEMWGGEMFKFLTVKPYRRDELIHIRNIKNIQKKKNIIIKKADKGNSMVALTREQYIKMGEKYLEKDAYGKPKDRNLQQSKEDNAQMIKTIKGLYPDFYNRHKNLFERTPIRDRYIYFLPKIHKPLKDGIYPERPITDTFGTNGITLDKIFMIYATKIRDTITTTTLDSLETVIKLEQFSKSKFNEKWVFLTFDIEDLYTNIPITDALDISGTELITNGILDKPLSRRLTNIIITLFTNNQIQFGDKIYGKSME